MTLKQALIHFYAGTPIRRKAWYYRYSIAYQDGYVVWRDVIAETNDMFRYMEYSLDELTPEDRRKRDWEIWKPIKWIGGYP